MIKGSRKFLILGIGGLLAATVQFDAKAVHAGDAALTAETQAAITPAKALSMLQEGNDRFVNGKTKDRDWHAQIEQTAKGQFPYAAVVSCLDSRIPPEVIFDQGIGDIFVARIAGNFVNTDILGSLEFATKLVGVKLVVVMGHTDCGAVKGACDGAELGLLTSTLANIQPAVAAVEGHDPRNSKNAEFVEAVTKENVHLAIRMLREKSEVLRELIDGKQIAVAAAMYDVSTGKVTFLD